MHMLPWHAGHVENTVRNFKIFCSMRRILLLMASLAILTACVKIIPEEPVVEPTFENYFGRVSLQPPNPFPYFFAVYGTLKAGDTVDAGYMAALISEFFWTDSVNFEKWRAGDTTAVLRDRTTDQSVIDRYIVIPEDGKYYFVVVNREDTTMPITVRLMRRAGQ